ncbi:pilus assembly protein PilZ [Xylella taiwanensis]|uniref:PilZ domain-containing protein n=1 Tax=Xylella taiwanensis TaxID=1444770 RepID=Z9JJF0_9GAMM|nr:PilZ domain-containing protein [Xylella taiwanensis]AXI83176.1 pilus assembly protein PilZ [Xylella taiwanensis]EWS77892.1 pilus biogenesis protein PilZ [Xylella taiwanensis]MCD8456226.1 PilZ domain-containing protein [Xylella taiwanensis]MCD8458634.1 PilZ domain-containing protein [Xylella taiwanensis]MCD8460769.1 PilZ domain-containing protein [Xylella taiwanensis]
MSATSPRQGILSLTLKDRAALYSAYMMYMKNGAIFVPTPKRYFLGNEVFLLLTLPDSSERLPVAGKVVWCTPVGAQGNRVAGIGVQLPDGQAGNMVRNRIETLLAGMFNSDKSTHTM